MRQLQVRPFRLVRQRRHPVLRGERFDPEAERLVTVAALLDAIYAEAACAS